MGIYHTLTERFRRNSAPGLYGPIGLEFARERLHAVQLRPHAGTARISASASVNYPVSREELMTSPEDMTRLVSHALDSDSFQGRETVSVMPQNHLRILSLSYQASGQGSDDSAILKRLVDRIDDDLSQYVIDYLPVRVQPQHNDRLAIVALARREDVISYLEVLRQSGLAVNALEIGPVSIARLVSTLGSSNANENIMVINFGRQVSFVTIVSRQRVLLDREINFGEDNLLDEVAQTLEVTPEATYDLIREHGIGGESKQGEVAQPFSADIDVAQTLCEIAKPALSRLIDEIGRALIYAASETRGEAVSRVYLAGSVARWNGASKLLNELLDIPVVNIPAPVFDTDSNQQNDISGPEFAIATGLALRGMQLSD